MSDPAPETDADRYRLTEAENREIFLNEIVPDRFAGREPQQVPVVVFLVGQPGAGKARVSQMLAEQLNQRGGFIDVDSDLYKPFHPAYDALLAENDTLMAAYTRADGRAWMAQAHDYVRAHKLNAVIQETSQDSEATAATMTAYRDAGFRVEARVLGVPAAMSNQGIVNRYYEQVQERGSGRLTVQRNADASYTGIGDLADLIDERHLADHVAVYRRGEGEPRHSNTLNAAGQWEHTPALRAAIETERQRPWTEAEATDFLKVQGKLTAELAPAWADRLDQIHAMAVPLMSHTTAYTQAEASGPNESLMRDAARHVATGLANEQPGRHTDHDPNTGPADPTRQRHQPHERDNDLDR